MVSTTKSVFSDDSDWVAVTAADKVFSDTVYFADNAWTTITLDTPFGYDGTHNIVIVVDDNTGSYKSNTPFLAFSAPSQAIRIYSDNINYDAFAPSSYSGKVDNTKNQIRLLKNEPVPCPEPTEFSATACESYMWDGETYATSGSHARTYTTAAGCDSVVTLHLTINQPVTNAISATACQSYTWNEQTYNASGEYTQTFTAANGCDSVVTLNLIINQPTEGDTTAVPLGGYS